MNVANQRQAVADLALRRAAIDGALVDAGADLLFQAADALHEELIEIVADDRQKLHALEQRRAAIFSLVQHPLVEVEPGQLTVQIELRRLQVLAGLRFRARGFLSRLLGFLSSAFRVGL